jgi:hypothetical protein
MIDASSVAVQSGARREMEPAWHLCRTLREGTDAMRRAGELYTPKTEKERRYPLLWDTRIRTAALMPFYAQAISRIASLPFQKAPTLTGELPPEIEPILADADRQGSTLESFAAEIYTDAIDKGMGMFLVDNVPTIKPDGSLMTLTEAEAMDARPYFRRIDPDNFRGAKVDTQGGRDEVVEFRFASFFWGQDDKGLDQRRERIEVWTRDTISWWITNISSSSGASSLGAGASFEREVPNTLGRIPLVVIYTNRTGALEAKPRLIDLAWQNVRHWNADSMQDGGVNFSRFPVLFMKGVSDETANSKPNIGAGATLADPSEQADLRVVETSGAALNAGEVQIARIASYCQQLGMQPLMEVGGPATATGEVRADMNEKSEAQAWISNVEWGIWNGLKLAAEWARVEIDESVDWTLFRDSSLISGRAQDVPLLLTALDKGLATPRTVLREMVLRGTFATISDPDAEIDAVEEAASASQQRQMEALARQLQAEDEKSEAGGKDAEGDEAKAEAPADEAPVA